ncbi:MAG: helix-turn-helix domain-containing protein [Pseudomonadota bacterium]
MDDAAIAQATVKGTAKSRTEKIDQLVAAALAEFAQRGLHGARVDAIAHAAAMNKRLLYHYVGNKEALFCAAVGEALRRLRVAARESGPEVHARAIAERAVDNSISDAWRLLCHAELEGLGLDSPARVALLQHWQGAGRNGFAEALLQALLPTCAAEWPLADEARPQESKKPRLKMRPQLRPGSGSR